jgi:hypothetical protein
MYYGEKMIWSSLLHRSTQVDSMDFFCIILNFLQVSMNLGILKQFLEFIYENEILKRSNGDMAECGPTVEAARLAHQP